MWKNRVRFYSSIFRHFDKLSSEQSNVQRPSRWIHGNESVGNKMFNWNSGHHTTVIFKPN